MPFSYVPCDYFTWYIFLIIINTSYTENVSLPTLCADLCSSNAAGLMSVFLKPLMLSKTGFPTLIACFMHHDIDLTSALLALFASNIDCIICLPVIPSFRYLTTSVFLLDFLTVTTLVVVFFCPLDVFATLVVFVGAFIVAIIDIYLLVRDSVQTCPAKMPTFLKGYIRYLVFSKVMYSFLLALCYYCSHSNSIRFRNLIRLHVLTLTINLLDVFSIDVTLLVFFYSGFLLMLP